MRRLKVRACRSRYRLRRRVRASQRTEETRHGGNTHCQFNSTRCLAMIKGISNDTYLGWNSLCELFLDTAARLDLAPCLWHRAPSGWVARSWRETEAEIASFAAGLQELGVCAGDRVLLVSGNRPEWLIAELAILSLGAVTVPAYVTNLVDDHLHVMNNSAASVAIVSTAALARTVADAARRSTGCRTLITMDDSVDPSALATLRHSTWMAVLEAGRRRANELRARVAQIKRSDLAVIFHTSGTSGPPRGVMLSHGSILTNCRGGYDRMQSDIDYGRDVFLSFLPLSHAYEHAAGQFTALSIGAQIFYCEAIERLLPDLATVRPTIMTAVPRLYETFHGRICQAMRKKAPIHQRVFNEAVRIGRIKYRQEVRLSPLDWLFDKTLGRLVRRSVASIFGGRLKFLVSGGAPLNYEVGEFFAALNIRLVQGYGQTEASPLITCNPPSSFKIDSVGPPLIGVDLRIADDGEICVRGELVMDGYCNDETATAKALEGGWLHTGDIGRLGPDGHLYITDRKKDIIVNTGGENIAPQYIEGLLTLQPEITQAMVYGDKRPHLVALIVADEDFLREWNRARGTRYSLAEASRDQQFYGTMQEVIQRLNKRLAIHERIRRFAIADTHFSVQNEMLTPSLKIRRHKILEMYSPVLTGLYH